LDLSGIEADYDEDRGHPLCHPCMMKLKACVHAYRTGTYSLQDRLFLSLRADHRKMGASGFRVGKSIGAGGVECC